MSGAIKAELLLQANHLQKERLVCLSAQDPFLSYWAEKTIITQLQSSSPVKYLRFPEPDDWSQLAQQLLQADLFSTATLNIVRIDKPSLLKDHPIATLLTNIVDKTPHQVVFILNKVNAAQQKTAWYKAFVKQSIMISSGALKPQSTAQWFTLLVKHYQLAIPANIQNAVCRTVEYDPSSLEQVVTQLALHQAKPPFTLESIQAYLLTTHAPSPIFYLLDPLCAGEYKYCHTQLHSESLTKEHISRLYWMFIKRLRQILQLAHRHLKTKTPIASLLQQERLWPQARRALTASLCLPYPQVRQHYLQFCDLEWLLKGVSPGDFHTTCIHHCLQFCAAVKNSQRSR